jgi:dUTP pyrophosphatase
MIKFCKLHPDAVIPTRATEGSAGFDLVIRDIIFDPLFDVFHVKTGIACEIPQDWVGQLVVRSSTHKKGLQLANQIGIIDSDFRGEIVILLKDNGLKQIKREPFPKAGDRIAQIVFVPCMTQSETVCQLTDTKRGSGSFGHTGV